MNKVIIFKNPDGGCGIIYPAPEMLNPFSKTRELLRLHGVDFADVKIEVKTEKITHIVPEKKLRKAKVKQTALVKEKKGKKLVEVEKPVEIEVDEEYFEDKKIIEEKSYEVLIASGVDASSDILNFIANKDVPNNLEWRITDEDNIPTDKTFRAAWTDNAPTETVDIDINKAKEIHINRLRELRQNKFIELGFPVRLNNDLEKAIVSESTQKKLKELRDVTKIDLSKIKTPEKLAAEIPDILK